jgi:hypothetical protein
MDTNRVEKDVTWRLLVEEREAHILLRLLLLNLLLLGGSLGGSSGGRGRGSNGKGGGVLDHLLQLLNLLERDLGSDGDGNEVLVSVDDDVGEGSNGGQVDSQGQRGNVGQTSSKVAQDIIISDIEDLSGVDGSVVVDAANAETIEEWLDVQHLKQSSLRRSNLLADLDQQNVRDDLDLTLVNLGGDVQGLEERGLGGLHTSVTGRDGNVDGGNGTGLGGGGNLEGEELGADGSEVSLGENQTNVTLQQRDQVSDGGILGGVSAEGTADHGLIEVR